MKDTDGKTVARISDIIVFSSDNRNNTFGEISYETVTEGCEYILRISLPAAYLSDPETHYPIYIDPTITVAYDANNSSTWNDIEDITVNQNQAADPPTSGTLYVGKAGADYGAMRSVMRFPELELYGIIPGNITSATVNVRDLMCYGFTLQVDCYGYGGTLPATAFTTSNMTWSAVYNTMQYYESNNVYRSTNYVSYNNGYNNSNQFWYEFNILSVVQSWAQGRNAGTLTKTDQAIVFKATDSYEQSTSTQYVCFGSYDRATNKPSLTITYLDASVVILLNQYSATILAGETLQLTATTIPSGLPVSWNSSLNYTATVSTSGLVTGIRTGTVTITAQCPGASASCTVMVIPLADGVYSIQNLDNYKHLTDGGDGDTVLSYLSGNSRSQMWLIKNVSGTTRYTLNPLSCTTIEYSGTDYGLLGGYDEYDTGVYIDSISNGSTSFSYGEWFISGNALSGFRIISYAADDYDIMVRNSSGTGVELEYEENLVDEEDPIDKWIVEPVSGLQPVTEISFDRSSVNIRLGGNDNSVDLKTIISFDSSDAPDQRVSFSKNNNNITLSAAGVATAQTLGYTVVSAAIGGHSDSITIRVCSPQIDSICLDNDRYHIWLYSGFHNGHTKNDEKKFIWTIDGYSNSDTVYFSDTMFNSECQSIVFDQYLPQQYKLFFDPTDDEDNRKYINCTMQNNSPRVTYSTSSNNATTWYVEYYGAFDQSPSSEIRIYTLINNVKQYLVFSPVTSTYVDMLLFTTPANNSNSFPKINATPAVLSDTDIALLAVSRSNVSGVEESERAQGWLDLINGAESLTDDIYGSSFKKTLNAHCDVLDDSIVYERFQNSRIIILRGHGVAGKLYYDEACYESNTLTSGEIASPNFSIPYAEIIIFGSCNSGSGGSMSLVSRASAKGVPIVIGFTDVLNRQVFAVFQYLFFEKYYCFLDGNTSYDSIEDVVSQSYASACALVNGQGCLVGDDNTVFSSIVIVETN